MGRGMQTTVAGWEAESGYLPHILIKLLSERLGARN